MVDGKEVARIVRSPCLLFRHSSAARQPKEMTVPSGENHFPALGDASRAKGKKGGFVRTFDRDTLITLLNTADVTPVRCRASHLRPLFIRSHPLSSMLRRMPPL